MLAIRNPMFKSWLSSFTNSVTLTKSFHLLEASSSSSPIKMSVLDWMTCGYWEGTERGPEEEALTAVKPYASTQSPSADVSLHVKQPFPEATQRLQAGLVATHPHLQVVVQQYRHTLSQTAWHYCLWWVLYSYEPQGSQEEFLRCHLGMLQKRASGFLAWALGPYSKRDLGATWSVQSSMSAHWLFASPPPPSSH